MLHKKKLAESGSGRFPEGKLGFAIGDIHGRADLLIKLLKRIEAETAKAPSLAPVVICLGDYIDRGMESAKVIDLLLASKERGFEWLFLRGNHEQAMQQFLVAPSDGRSWLAFGGVETLMSYGVKPLSVESPPEALITAAADLDKKLPDAHRAFYDSLLPSVTLGDYFFAHAGIDPDRSEEDQSEHDLYWIRERFLRDRRRWSKIVVHGHTPIKEAYRDHRRIGIDTGAYATGRLTAARFEGNEVAFITV